MNARRSSQWRRRRLFKLTNGRAEKLRTLNTFRTAEKRLYPSIRFFFFVLSPRLKNVKSDFIATTRTTPLRAPSSKILATPLRVYIYIRTSTGETSFRYVLCSRQLFLVIYGSDSTLYLNIRRRPYRLYSSMGGNRLAPSR